MTIDQAPDQHELAQSVLAPAPETPSSPPPERWRLRDLFMFILVIPLVLVISNVLTLVGYALLEPLAGWNTPIYELQTNAVFGLTLQLIFYAFLLAYVYYLIVVRYRAPFWAALKWTKLSAHNALRFFLGGSALSLLIMVAPSFLPERKEFPFQKMFNSPTSAYAVAAFAVVVAPFVEELLFRGLLFAFFERRVGIKFAVITTAVLFAGLHIPEYWGAWNHVLMILVVGLTFSLVRGLTGSVSPSFILHLAYNSTLMLMLFLRTQHFQHIPGVLLF